MSVSYVKSKHINGILTQSWLKDSIFDDICVSGDDWDHHISFRWRGDIKQDIRPDIFFSSRRVYTDDLSISHGKNEFTNGIFTQNLFKYSILDDIGISDDDWDHHRSSGQREYIDRSVMIFSSKMRLKWCFFFLFKNSKPRNGIFTKMSDYTSLWDFLINVIFGVYLVIEYIFYLKQSWRERIEGVPFTFLSLPNKFSLNGFLTKNIYYGIFKICIGGHNILVSILVYTLNMFWRSTSHTYVFS